MEKALEKAVKELQAKSNYPSRITGASSSSSTIIARVQLKLALYNKALQSDLATAWLGR